VIAAPDASPGRAALPFQAGAPPATPATPAAAPVPAGTPMGQTADGVKSPLRPVLPFTPPADARKRVASMTLAHYAQICADVRAYPEQVERIRGHYGLDEAAWAALHGLWRERFQRDPALHARWEALIQQRMQAAKRAPAEPPGSRRARAPRPAQASSGSLDLDTAPDLVAPRGPVLPFQPATSPVGQVDRPVAPPRAPEQPAADAAPGSEPHAGALKLGQYASLCAELSAFPDASEAIFRRYGLDTKEKRAAVDAAWKERLGRDPAAYEKWKNLYQRYHAHLTKGGAPPE
jgi:hypothetical protein